MYKAQFVQSGTLFLHNPPIGPNYRNVDSFDTKSIVTLPRKLKVGITTSYNLNSILGSSGTKVSDGQSIGYIEQVGGPIRTLGVNNAGIGYSNGTYSNVPLYNITGSGSGATATLVFSNNQLTSITSLSSTNNKYTIIHT